jgi:putative RNA 2'-phosphotransferase
MKSPAVRLAKMLAYVLGRRPDEFGLVTDPEGFVKIKDLLKALGEEEGFRHVRRGSLDEILVTMPEAPIEIQEGRIRAKDRTNLVPHVPPDTPPKLLYTCVRRKAYPVALEKGIFPGNHPMVLLSSDQEMAKRIGCRSDGAPVMLTVSMEQARRAGVRFLSAGGSLYLSQNIPPSCFSGPPLRRVQDEPPSREQRVTPPEPKMPGSFFPDPAEILVGEEKGKKDRRGKRPEWKRDRKRMQRMERKKGSRF